MCKDNQLYPDNKQNKPAAQEDLISLLGYPGEEHFMPNNSG